MCCFLQVRPNRQPSSHYIIFWMTWQSYLSFARFKKKVSSESASCVCSDVMLVSSSAMFCFCGENLKVFGEGSFRFWRLIWGEYLKGFISVFSSGGTEGNKEGISFFESCTDELSELKTVWSIIWKGDLFCDVINCRLKISKGRRCHLHARVLFFRLSAGNLHSEIVKHTK